MPLLEKEPLEGILFADLESGRLWGDADVMAAATLPKPHVEPFASALKKVMRKAKESGGPVDDFAVGEAALRFMASLLGHYRQHVRGDDAAPPAVGRGRSDSGVAPDRKGSLLGVIDKIPYLQELGITAVELLPVFQFDPQDAHPIR